MADFTPPINQVEMQTNAQLVQSIQKNTASLLRGPALTPKIMPNDAATHVDLSPEAKRMCGC